MAKSSPKNLRRRSQRRSLVPGTTVAATATTTTTRARTRASVIRTGLRTVPRRVTRRTLDRWVPVNQIQRDQILQTLSLLIPSTLRTVRGDERRRAVQEGLAEVHRMIGERLYTTLIPPDTPLSSTEISHGTRELERQLKPQVEQILALEAELQRAQREVEEEREVVEGFREAAQATEQYQQRLHRSRLHPSLQALDTPSNREEGAHTLQTPLLPTEISRPSDTTPRRDQILEKSLKNTFTFLQHHMPHHLSGKEALSRVESMARLQRMEDELLNALDRRGLLPRVMDQMDQEVSKP